MSVVAKEIKALLHSPGGWFFASNAVLYTQTHPLVAFVFLASLVTQRILHYNKQNESRTGVLGLVAGPHGILAVNAMMTLSSALITAFVGLPVLALSGLAFGGANLTQAIVYSRPRCRDAMRTRHMILALCEFSIAFGLALIAVNAGYSMPVSFGLVIPVIVAGFVRSFRAHWLPPGLAYADMMFLTVMTMYEAILTGNGANAISRVIVLFGLSRLAVLRARNEGKTSLFEIERFFRRTP